MPERCCWGRRTGRSGWSIGLPSVLADSRAPEPIEHTVGTLVGQRNFALALGYENLVYHDELRHDPTMAVLAGKLSVRRKDCAPLAGKSRSTGSSGAERS